MRMETHFKVAEVAARWRVNKTTVHHWIRTGQLKPINIGMGTVRPRYRITMEELLRFEATRVVGATEAPRMRVKSKHY